MRRRVELPNNSAPIHILVSTTSSTEIDAEYLQKRGTVILALVLALSAIRPVSLHVFAMLDGNVNFYWRNYNTSQNQYNAFRFSNGLLLSHF